MSGAGTRVDPTDGIGSTHDVPEIKENMVPNGAPTGLGCSDATDPPLIDFGDDSENIAQKVDTQKKPDVATTNGSTADPLTVMETFLKYEAGLEPRDYITNFFKIRLEQEDMRRLPEYESLIATSPMHYQRNRYRDILPYDANRVVLKLIDQAENGEGYINASNIDLGGTKFIAAQAPLPTTLGEWWAMIEEFDVSLVVMLCRLVEMSKIKCERYWPETVGESQIYGDNYEVTVEAEERFDSDDEYVLRRLRFENMTTGVKKVVHQLHYTEWPDHGCPAGEHQLLRMIDKMAELQEGRTSPVLVHCSAGVGRTGTIIAVNHVRELIKANKLTELNLYDLVMQLRTQRSSMVQTQDQYQFVHKCVAHYCKEQLGLPIPEPAPKVKPNGENSAEGYALAPPPPVFIQKKEAVEDDDDDARIQSYPDEPDRPLGPETS
ncbi:unnamed protein product, partial [Mesorhabditis spiculigera]